MSLFNKLILFIILTTSSALAQFGVDDFGPQSGDDLHIGGDIFSDYNEDVESTQVLEDERFYRYGRFFTFSLSAGTTTFTGNRGAAYSNDPPSFGFAVSFFLNFRVAYQLGLGYSKHTMIINGEVKGFDNAPGTIEVTMLRPYFAFKYYIDTSDLGTAWTYSNPYFISRLEYWSQKNKFVDDNNGADTFEDQSGGGLGLGIGMGLEFPLQLKEYYLGIEFLYHRVNFFDKNTTDFQEDTTSTNTEETFEDLQGDAFTFMISYIVNW